MFLFKTLGIIFFSILMVLLANEINFYYQVPQEYRSANFKGHWKSSTVSFIGGKILADLPDPLPLNEEFEVDALIYYNVWSIHKMGKFQPFVLIGQLGDDQTAGSGQQASIDEAGFVSNKPLINYNFKAKIQGETKQIIDYTGVSDKHKHLILGGYQSLHPADMGNFVLKKK